MYRKYGAADQFSFNNLTIKIIQFFNLLSHYIEGTGNFQINLILSELLNMSKPLLFNVFLKDNGTLFYC